MFVNLLLWIVVNLFQGSYILLDIYLHEIRNAIDPGVDLYTSQKSRTDISIKI